MLWTNPNRLVALNPTTITVQGLNGFDEIEVISTTSTGASACIKTYCNKTLTTARIEGISYGNTFGSSMLFRRDVVANFNSNTITINEGISTGSSAVTNNSICIPVQIYGIKH